MQLHPTLHRRYFERVAGLNCEKLDVFKPGQYQPPGEDFKPSFKQKITFFLKKVRVIVWSLDFSIANQLSTNLPFSWIQFLFFYERMDWRIFRYKSMKSVKIKINRWTKRECYRFLPIDRYNRYQSNQIHRFLSIYRLTTPGFELQRRSREKRGQKPERRKNKSPLSAPISPPFYHYSGYH